MGPRSASVVAFCVRVVGSLFFALPDWAILLKVRAVRGLLRWRDPSSPLVTVLNDVERIFSKPASSALARRMWREARREQVSAILKGALRS